MGTTSIARALTIAGSDSGGCAGIQADLKTFAALRVHGMSAITAITAQDTCRVHSVLSVSPEMVEAQIRAVIEDIGVDALKTGMLPTGPVISRVALLIAEYRIENVVVDPVMVSTSGDALIDPDAVAILRDELLPKAMVVTPNLPEARLLCGEEGEPRLSVPEMARRILEHGPRSIVIKGGHSSDRVVSEDYFSDGRESTSLRAPRVDTSNTHGSGCTFSAAITASLARGAPLEQALREAKEFVTQALKGSLSIGKGHGPLGHFGLS